MQSRQRYTETRDGERDSENRGRKKRGGAETEQREAQKEGMLTVKLSLRLEGCEL